MYGVGRDAYQRSTRKLFPEPGGPVRSNPWRTSTDHSDGYYRVSDLGGIQIVQRLGQGPNADEGGLVLRGGRRPPGYDVVVRARACLLGQQSGCDRGRSIAIQLALQPTKLAPNGISVSERFGACRRDAVRRTCMTIRICCSSCVIRPRVTRLRYLSRRSVCCGRREAVLVGNETE